GVEHTLVVAHDHALFGALYEQAKFLLVAARQLCWIACELQADTRWPMGQHCSGVHPTAAAFPAQFDSRLPFGRLRHETEAAAEKIALVGVNVPVDLRAGLDLFDQAAGFGDRAHTAGLSEN